MKITYVNGDLLASSERVIAHGCNAKGVMRSGIAKAIREQYSQAYNDYYSTYVKQRGLNLGQVIVTELPERTILNIITQEDYGYYKNVQYVSYGAIKDGILNINQLGYDRVAFPLIGAGLANGNWKDIAAIIEENSNFSPIIYYLNESEDIVRDAQA